MENQILKTKNDWWFQKNTTKNLLISLNIDKTLNAQSIINNPKICIMDDGKKYDYTTDTRVGIDYALPKDKNAKLRFILKQ